MVRVIVHFLLGVDLRIPFVLNGSRECRAEGPTLNGGLPELLPALVCAAL